MKLAARAWSFQRLDKSIVTTFLWFLGSFLTILFPTSEVSGCTPKLDSHTLKGHTSKNIEEIEVAIASLSSLTTAEPSSEQTDRNVDGEQTTRIQHHPDQVNNLENISFYANRLLIEIPGTNGPELPPISIAQATGTPPADTTQTLLETTPVAPLGEPDVAAAQPNLAQQSQTRSPI